MQRDSVADPSHEAADRSIRILVAEGDTLLKDRLTALSADYSDLELVGVAHTAKVAMAMASELRPDVMLVAAGLPDGDGLRVCDHLNREVPCAASIFVSESQTDALLLSVVEAGACGVVSRMAPDDELILAILRAAEGDLLFPKSVTLRLFRRERELRLRALARAIEIPTLACVAETARGIPS